MYGSKCDPGCMNFVPQLNNLSNVDARTSGQRCAAQDQMADANMKQKRGYSPSYRSACSASFARYTAFSLAVGSIASIKLGANAAKNFSLTNASGRRGGGNREECNVRGSSTQRNESRRRSPNRQSTIWESANAAIW